MVAVYGAGSMSMDEIDRMRGAGRWVSGNAVVEQLGWGANGEPRLLSTVMRPPQQKPRELSPTLSSMTDQWDEGPMGGLWVAPSPPKPAVKPAARPSAEQAAAWTRVIENLDPSVRAWFGGGPVPMLPALVALTPQQLAYVSLQPNRYGAGGRGSLEAWTGYGGAPRLLGAIPRP